MGTKAWIMMLLTALALSASALPLGGAAGTAATIHLYGNAVQGWGSTPDALSNPGPQIQMVQGQAQGFLFHSVDGIQHEFFIDLNNNFTKNPGEPDSGDFSTASGLAATITAEQAGQFTYRCKYHPTTMTGTVVVQAPSTNPTPNPQPSSSATNLLPFVAIGLAVVAVGAVAGIYMVRRRH